MYSVREAVVDTIQMLRISIANFRWASDSYFRYLGKQIEFVSVGVTVLGLVSTVSA